MTLGIVTISFNQARYLSEAMKSVRLADPSRLRFVIVDPGSTDGSRELIEQNKNLFSKIILETDRGPADGLNKGFAACDADVLGYLNSDDRFRPNALDFVLQHFERHPETDVLLGAIAIIDGNGRPGLRKRTQDSFNLRKYAIDACNVFQQGTFFRRQAFLKTGGFNVANRSCWDGELVVDLALRGCRFTYVNKVLGDFRLHGDSITGSNRLAEQYRRDREAIRLKIQNAGVSGYSPIATRVVKWAHKFNVRRHISYFLTT